MHFLNIHLQYWYLGRGGEGDSTLTACILRWSTCEALLNWYLLESTLSRWLLARIYPLFLCALSLWFKLKMGFTFFFYAMTKSNCSYFRNLGWYHCDDIPCLVFSESKCHEITSSVHPSLDVGPYFMRMKFFLYGNVNAVILLLMQQLRFIYYRWRSHINQMWGNLYINGGKFHYTGFITLN